MTGKVTRDATHAGRPDWVYINDPGTVCQNQEYLDTLDSAKPAAKEDISTHPSHN